MVAWFSGNDHRICSTSGLVSTEMVIWLTIYGQVNHLNM